MDGLLRIAIGEELGIEQLPVRVVQHLRTYADQALHAFAKNQRKELTEQQRALQEQEVAKAIRGASTDWKRAHGFHGKRTADIVAALVNTPERTLRRRQKVFTSPTSPPSLKKAVNAGLLSVSAANDILVEAEQRFSAGTDLARRAVNEAVAELRRSGRRRPGRAPKTPMDDVHPDSHACKSDFLDSDLEKRLGAWAFSCVRSASLPTLSSMLEPFLVRDFIVDVRLAAAELRRRLKRIGAPAATAMLPANPYPELNRLLENRFGIEPLRRGEAPNIGALQRAYRKAARLVHPDLNKDNPEATNRAQQLNADYERAMVLIEIINKKQED